NDIYPPDIAVLYRAADLAVIESRTPLKSEDKLTQAAHGVNAYFETIKIPFFDKTGAVAGVYAVDKTAAHPSHARFDQSKIGAAPKVAGQGMLPVRNIGGNHAVIHMQFGRFLGLIIADYQAILPGLVTADLQRALDLRMFGVAKDQAVQGLDENHDRAGIVIQMTQKETGRLNRLIRAKALVECFAARYSAEPMSQDLLAEVMRTLQLEIDNIR
ncbi:MAG: hypothetical protein WCO84_05865, partial [bacterium]